VPARCPRRGVAVRLLIGRALRPLNTNELHDRRVVSRSRASCARLPVRRVPWDRRGVRVAVGPPNGTSASANRAMSRATSCDFSGTEHYLPETPGSDTESTARAFGSRPLIVLSVIVARGNGIRYETVSYRISRAPDVAARFAVRRRTQLPGDRVAPRPPITRPVFVNLTAPRSSLRDPEVGTLTRGEPSRRRVTNMFALDIAVHSPFACASASRVLACNM